MSKEWLNNIKISQELKDKIYYDKKNDLWVISWNAVGEALTPPTVDEVCEALSEYLGREVIFKHNSFHIRYEGHTKILVINHLTDKPHLITLIGRFYQSLEEAEHERD